MKAQERIRRWCVLNYGEVEDEDSDKLEVDDFASSSEESEAAEKVAAARANRSIGRTLSQIFP
jgi:hypothetical protein